MYTNVAIIFFFKSGAKVRNIFEIIRCRAEKVRKFNGLQRRNLAELLAYRGCVPTHTADERGEGGAVVGRNLELVGVSLRVGIVGEVGGVEVVACLGEHRLIDVGSLDGFGHELLGGYADGVEGVGDLGVEVGVAQVELSADESHQARLGNLYAEVAVAVGLMGVERAEVAGAGGIGGGDNLRHVVVFERGGKGELSHIVSMFKFDIWNALVRHHV